MSRTARRAMTTVLLSATLTVGAVACVPVPIVIENERVQGTAAPDASAPATCDGAPATIVGDDQDVVLRGNCPSVILAGSGIRLDAEDARIGSLEISGDRADVDAGAIGTLTMAGQSSEVEADSLSSLVVNGDRNVVEVAGAAESIAVNGNDNRVDAGELGTVVDQGLDNHVTRSDR